MGKKIMVFDTTLRDGEQTPGVNLNLKEKLELAMQLESLGVDIIEAGFPAASPGDFQAVQGVARRLKDTVVCGLCRAVEGDINSGWEAVREAVSPRIHVFMATSPLHMQYKLKMSPDKVYERSVAAVRYAKGLCPDVEFSPEDGSRTEPEFLYKVLTGVIDAGANVVNIPDTVGYAQTHEFEAFIRGIFEHVPNIHKAAVSIHCHNDLGLAVANTLAGIRAGATQFEGTINGIGERAGNAAIEDVVMNLKTRPAFFDCETKICTERIYRTSRMVASLTGLDIPVNKPVVGQNAFRHESGIHQHGVMANAATYEIMTPESIGVPKSRMVLGKLSGRHAFAERVEELGYRLEGEALDGAFARFKVLADRKKELDDRDIEALLQTGMDHEVPAYELESFLLQSGNRITATASVTLAHGGEKLTEAAVGDGPVDALYNAVIRIIGRQYSLDSYVIRAVTEGADALGEVTVRLSDGERFATGRGLSTDIIEASLLAYMSAVNRLID